MAKQARYQIVLRHRGAPGPGWNSGWVAIAPGQTITFTHGLNLPPERLGLELWFQDTNGHGGINRAGYGEIENDGHWYGAYWHHFTSNTVQVTRLSDDRMADRVRVRVWVADQPGYDSGWVTVARGNTHFDHNLGITETDLIAFMWFSDTLHGIHQYAYGGLTEGDDETGAYWMRLTSSSMQVCRRLDDDYVQQVRVIVTEPDPPDYDSLVALGGWQDVASRSVFTLTHNLHQNPDYLVVRADCHDTTPGGAGIHHLWAGGDACNSRLFQGGHIQNLTATTVHFVRRHDDTGCKQVRVRIWKRAQQRAMIYLPLAMRSSRSATELAYDDGTADSNQSYTTGSGFAVRFTPPSGGGKLLRGRFYLIAPVAPSRCTSGIPDTTT